MDKGAITAAVAAALVAEQFPQWAELPVAPVRVGRVGQYDVPAGRHDVGSSPEPRPVLTAGPKGTRVVTGPRSPATPPDPRTHRAGAPERHLSTAVVDLPLDRGSACGGRLRQRPQILRGRPRGLPCGPLRQRCSPRASAGHAQLLPRRGSADLRQEVRAAIDILADAIDRDIVTALWEAALGSSWDRPSVWVHGDVAPSNLLLVHGQLAAVIDFGCAAVGDPSCDLVMAWTFFSDTGRETFQDALGFDAATWTRAHGWALWKALITLAAREAGWPRSGHRGASVGLALHRAGGARLPGSGLSHAGLAARVGANRPSALMTLQHAWVVRLKVT